jgi:hypothetical protein
MFSHISHLTIEEVLVPIPSMLARSLSSHPGRRRPEPTYSSSATENSSSCRRLNNAFPALRHLRNVQPASGVAFGPPGPLRNGSVTSSDTRALATCPARREDWRLWPRRAARRQGDKRRGRSGGRHTARPANASATHTDPGDIHPLLCFSARSRRAEHALMMVCSLVRSCLGNDAMGWDGMGYAARRLNACSCYTAATTGNGTPPLPQQVAVTVHVARIYVCRT